MTAMPVSLLAWKAVQRNTLRGFAKVRLGKSMTIADVALHVANGRRWAQLPSKAMVNSGELMRDDAGKIKYVPVIEWLDRESADRFSNGVIEAVEREHPGATAAEAPAP